MVSLMKIRMAPEEISLLDAFISCSARYLEFGSGGTTCLAASKIRDWVISVDSSQDWLDRVASSCAEHETYKQPTLIDVDIGRTKAWGYPDDQTTKPRWATYHEAVWQRDERAATADLFLIDGRFRVACFLQVVSRAAPGALIAIHDFQRPEYQVVREFAREIASARYLSVFQVEPGRDADAVGAALKHYATKPQ